MRDKSKASYEWVLLKRSNINYVAGMTGKSKDELDLILRKAAREGKSEVKLPLGVNYFTREER